MKKLQRIHNMKTEELFVEESDESDDMNVEEDSIEETKPVICDLIPKIKEEPELSSSVTYDFIKQEIKEVPDSEQWAEEDLYYETSHIKQEEPDIWYHLVKSYPVVKLERCDTKIRRILQQKSCLNGDIEIKIEVPDTDTTSELEIPTSEEEEYYLEDINTIIKDELVLEEVEKEENTQEGYLFTPVNNICTEEDPTLDCEVYRRKSMPNQSVLSALPVRLNYSRAVSKNKSYQCRFCTHLSPHKLIHSGIKKYQCDVCSRSFTKLGSLSKHKLIHSGIKKYQCDVCSRSFTVSGSLSKHKLIHSGIKKYQCDACSRSFTEPGNLSKHKLLHSGIKKYQCDVCSKSFTTTWNLSQHKFIHSGIKKYQCDVCSRSFTEFSTLSRHKVIHSGIKKYQCDVCSKSFTQSSSLSKHKLIHSGIKYQCDVCSRSFTESGSLSRHKVIHSGIYQCDVCSKSFTKSYLSQHKLIHSGIKK